MATATHPRTRLLAGLTLLALSIAVAACNPSADGQADTESVALDAETPADTETPATEDRPTGDEADDAGNDVRDEPPPPGEVLASAENTWAGSTGGPFRLDVLSLARRGQDFVELRLAVHAIGSNVYVGDNLGSGSGSWDLSGIIIEDVDAGERLLVLRDSEGACVCSTGLHLDGIPQGETRELFARFPAPVSDLVDIAVPTFAPFNDVPVS